MFTNRPGQQHLHKEIANASGETEPKAFAQSSAKKKSCHLEQPTLLQETHRAMNIASAVPQLDRNPNCVCLYALLRAGIFHASQQYPREHIISDRENADRAIVVAIRRIVLLVDLANLRLMPGIWDALVSRII